jgi:predicted helicase
MCAGWSRRCYPLLTAWASRPSTKTCLYGIGGRSTATFVLRRRRRSIGYSSATQFIYFYEDYLRAYDKETSKSRGVYYTPPPIVNFIVRAVDNILKERFGIPSGLADHHRVMVLDFACGTGTFLLEVFQRSFENIGGPDAGQADLIVREHFLKNVFGFEYLIAPYTIAHLKLSQYLSDQNHPLKGDERLQVFLTNTVEPIEPQANLLLPAISAEVEAS